MLPIHPVNFVSKYKVSLDTFPGLDEWKGIFRMFPFSSRLEFSKYYQNIRDILKDNELEIIMSACSLEANSKTEDELKTLSTLSPVLEKFYIKKNLPVDLLKLLRGVENIILEDVYKYLSKEYIKNNIAKEILRLLIDLRPADQKKLIEEMNQAYQKISKDGLRFLNHHYRRAAYVLRYPRKEKLTAEINRIIRDMKLDSSIRVKFDESLEKTSLSLEIEIYSENDVNKLSSTLYQKSFLKNLKTIFHLLK